MLRFPGLGRKHPKKNNENRHFVDFSGASAFSKLILILPQKLSEISEPEMNEKPVIRPISGQKP